MDRNYEIKVSKFISLVLRHKPEVVNIQLDKNGWANVSELLSGINKKGYRLTIIDLKNIVANDEKKRYSFSEDFAKIRANQGHSIKVDVELKKKKPPLYLYHGTGIKSLESIKANGLKPMKRLYAHLSPDFQTATAVGKRHGEETVLRIKAEEMFNDGYKFYLSENNVWLTECVPVKYIIFYEAYRYDKI